MGIPGYTPGIDGPPLFGQFPLVINYYVDHPIDGIPLPGGADDAAQSITYDLSAIVSPTAYVQFAWLGPYSYQAPVVASVPELSTWAMLLIGFASLGFVVYRRHNEAPA